MPKDCTYHGRCEACRKCPAVLAVVLLLLLAGCFSNTGGSMGEGVLPWLNGSSDCEAPAAADASQQQIVDLVNTERQARGLGPVSVNPLLTQVAEAYACEMITQDFFGHFNPLTGEGPGERAQKAGYVFLSIGENLAAGQQTPEQVMADWMSSTQGHRENILHPAWTELGVGVRTGGTYGMYWVQEFAQPP